MNESFKNFKKYIAVNTDRYFSRTQRIVKDNGDKAVTYAFFLRTNSLYAPHFTLEFLNRAKKELGLKFKLYQQYQEEDIIKAEAPIWFIEGSLVDLCELETLLLQTIGYPFVAAYNAYLMSKTLKNTAFISMGARHYPSSNVANMVDYGVSVGSNKAKAEGAKGFLGSSTADGSKFFNLSEGLGTMPHSLIGYAGSTLKAAQLYHMCFKNDSLIVLVDFFGKEITDSLAVCKHFKELAQKGELGIRLDTHGGRYLQGLNEAKSWQIVNKYVNPKIIKSFNKKEITHLVGKGVSAAAIFAVKEALQNAGFPLVKIVVSSGFNIEKCKVMAQIKAPIDVVGTGSLLADNPNKTFATADIVAYNNVPLIKKGREYLIKAWQLRVNH
mgnify:CR=1 FL=1